MGGSDTQEEVRRVAAALRTVIRLSGVSHRRIERELQMSTGYLTRLLGGQVQLRVSHVLLICEVIELPVGSFFAAVFPAVPPADAAQGNLLRGLRSLHPQPEPPRHSDDPAALLAELGGFLQELRGRLVEEEES